jgi:hypothetical protein
VIRQRAGRFLPPFFALLVFSSGIGKKISI